MCHIHIFFSVFFSLWVCVCTLLHCGAFFSNFIIHTYIIFFFFLYFFLSSLLHLSFSPSRFHFAFRSIFFGFFHKCEKLIKGLPKLNGCRRFFQRIQEQHYALMMREMASESKGEKKKKIVKIPYLCMKNKKEKKM